MGMALQKSTDCGTTFQQVSVDQSEISLGGGYYYNNFYTIKDSKNNTYIFCRYLGGVGNAGKIIKISSAGVKTYIALPSYFGDASDLDSCNPMLSRDENSIFFLRTAMSYICQINTDLLSQPTYPFGTSMSVSKFAIYQDQYIWVASGTTVSIYKYDTKEWKASNTTVYAINTITCSAESDVYAVDSNGYMYEFTFNGISTIAKTQWDMDASPRWNAKQLLIDRFGDLIILTNTGTASTLLKYSNTGTLIDTVSLSVGTNKGAYGLQVYSSDNGTKCWVQFSNDLGTWRTEAKNYDATPANRTFGDVRKIRDNGDTTYGSDHGGDNNYSVRC